MWPYPQITPPSTYYQYPPGVPSRKPGSEQYDGTPDLQQSRLKDSSHLAATREQASDSVTGTTPNNKEGKRLSRAPNVIARGMAREAAKKKVKEHKEHKKVLRQEEKARKRWLGGVAWGFDPTAGMLSSQDTNEADGGCYVAAGRSLQGLEGLDELDEVGRRTGRRWVSHNLWGIEHGGPGNEGKHGHGSLRDREPSLDVSALRKPRSPSPWRSDSGSRSRARLA